MAGFQVNVEGLRLELGLDRLQVSHITTSFKSFGRKTQGEAERRNRLKQWLAVSLSAQNQSSDDDEVMIVQVFLAGLAFSSNK